MQGSTARSYGIQVARLAGVPREVIQHAKKVLSEIENREQGLHGSLAESARGTRGQTQLSLFRKPEEKLIENLQNLDISTMTPLEAMNVLNQLKEKAGNISF